MNSPSRAVFDCNVLLQSLLSSHGPAGKLLESAKQHKLKLFVSQYVLDELREVGLRPKVQRKYNLTSKIVERFCDELLGHATLVEIVPHIFDFPRDPDDAHYIDLAIAANAVLVVSRDQDPAGAKANSPGQGKASPASLAAAPGHQPSSSLG